jgi:hypothetical protein
MIKASQSTFRCIFFTYIGTANAKRRPQCGQTRTGRSTSPTSEPLAIHVSLSPSHRDKHRPRSRSDPSFLFHFQAHWFNLTLEFHRSSRPHYSETGDRGQLSVFPHVNYYHLLGDDLGKYDGLVSIHDLPPTDVGTTNTLVQSHGLNRCAPLCRYLPRAWRTWPTYQEPDVDVEPAHQPFVKVAPIRCQHEQDGHQLGCDQNLVCPCTGIEPLCGGFSEERPIPIPTRCSKFIRSVRGCCPCSCCVALFSIILPSLLHNYSIISPYTMNNGPGE